MKAFDKFCLACQGLADLLLAVLLLFCLFFVFKIRSPLKSFFALGAHSVQYCLKIYSAFVKDWDHSIWYSMMTLSK